MSTQPEALRLADTLEKHLGGNTATKAAAELRRLHALNQELIAALKALQLYETLDGPEQMKTERAVRAALLKAEGYV